MAFFSGRTIKNAAALIWAAGAVSATGAFAACVGDEPASNDDAGDATPGDAGSGDGAANDGGNGPGTLSVGADQDPTKGNADEKLTVHRAVNEGAITAYNIYWSSAGGKGASITSLPKTGGDLTYQVTGAIPADATQYLLFTANTDGSESQIAAADVRDNFPIFIDVSASTDAGGGGDMGVVVDSTNGKLLVTGPSGTVRGYLRCDLADVTGATCTFVPVAVATLVPSALSNPVIDTTNGRILMVATDTRAARGQAEGVFGCNLADTTGATSDFVNTSVPDASFQDHASAFCDSAGKLFAASVVRVPAGDVIDILKCNLTPAVTGCVHAQGAVGGQPSAAYDSLGGYVDVAAIDASQNLRLFRFDTAGLGFAQNIDISAAKGPNTGTFPSLVLDLENQKLLVVADNNMDGDKLALFRCNLADTTGASCTYTDISAGQSPIANPHAAIDTVNKKLLVVTDNSGNNDKPGLVRCNLDGTSCTYVDISAGQGINSGTTPSIALDLAGQRLFALTNDGANDRPRPAIFTLGLW